MNVGRYISGEDRHVGTARIVPAPPVAPEPIDSTVLRHSAKDRLLAGVVPKLMTQLVPALRPAGARGKVGEFDRLVDVRNAATGVVTTWVQTDTVYVDGQLIGLRFTPVRATVQQQPQLAGYSLLLRKM